MARPARDAVGTLGRRALRSTSSGSPTGSTRSPASSSCATRRRERYTNERGETVTDDGASRRMGRDVLRPEERVAHRAGRRRRRVREAHRASVARGARRDGAVRPGPDRAATVRRRRRDNGSPPRSSTTARGRSTATPRPNCTRMSVIFNLTQTESGARRARCSRASCTGRSSTRRPSTDRSSPRASTALGYEIERGASGQPEIRGYTPAYLDASSPRRQQIQDYLEKEGRRGAGAAQIAAHQTREAKVDARA